MLTFRKYSPEVYQLFGPDSQKAFSLEYDDLYREWALYQCLYWDVVKIWESRGTLEDPPLDLALAVVKNHFEKELNKHEKGLVDCTMWLDAFNTSRDDREQCPECDGKLVNSHGGGVVCSGACGYWFCY